MSMRRDLVVLDGLKGKLLEHLRRLIDVNNEGSIGHVVQKLHGVQMVIRVIRSWVIHQDYLNIQANIHTLWAIKKRETLLSSTL